MTDTQIRWPSAPSALEDSPPAPRGRAPAPAPAAPRRPPRVSRRPTLPLGWPLVVLFAGYPLWWAMGIAPFMALGLAIPLALQLRRVGALKAPRGFGVWLLLLVWLLIGVLVLQVDAPEAVPGSSSGRYITFAYRFAWFLGATVCLLFVGNMRHRLSKMWFARVVGSMFLVVVAGGLLGTLFSSFQFPSLLELALGGSNKSNPFVYSLIHPSAAQIQTFLGYEQGRASAPFPYTNEWGLNFAVTLPFFVAGWFHRASQQRRLFGAAVLVVSVVPVVSSLNRGLWLALVAGGLFLAIRFAVMGRPLVLAAVLVAAALVTALIVFSPLGGLVAQRLDNGNSNTGRTNLGTQTLVSTWTGSPVVGFGTTRDPAGNWNSIAAGSTQACPRCTPPPMGTQGQFWLLLFTGGFGAVLLYLWFFGSAFVRHLRLTSPYVVLGLSTVFMHLVTLPFYNAVDTALYVTMIAVGLMWRVSQDVRSPADPDRSDASPSTASVWGPAPARVMADPALSLYPRLLRRHWLTITAAGLIGAGVGGLLQLHDGLQVRVSQQILVKNLGNATGSELAAAEFSLDTEAQIARSGPVLDAIRATAGPKMSQEDLLSRVDITALPNTRILVLGIELPRGRASDAIQAASAAYLKARSDMVNTTRLEQIATLDSHIKSLTTTIDQAEAIAAKLAKTDSSALRKTISRASNELRDAEVARTRLANNQYDVGQAVGNPRVQVIDDPLFIGVASGLAIGLLLGMVLAWLLDGTRERVHRRFWRWSRMAREAPPVLCRIQVPEATHRAMARTDPALAQAKMALTSYAPVSAVIPVGDRRVTGRVLSLLDAWLLEHYPRSEGGRVVLIAPGSARMSEVRRAAGRARRHHQAVIGLIMIEEC